MSVRRWLGRNWGSGMVDRMCLKTVASVQKKYWFCFEWVSVNCDAKISDQDLRLF
jgi:hypothetical protein